MIYDKQKIPELNTLLHRNDNPIKNYVDYEKNILNKSLSPYIYSNNRMSNFLNGLNELVSMFFDQFNIIKNWRNYSVDKYFYKQSQ